MPVILFGILLTGAGLMGGRDGLALTGMVVGGLGIVLWFATPWVVAVLLHPAEGRRPVWALPAASLLLVPLIGLCAVAPVLLLLAYERGDRSLLNTAAVVGGMSIVIMGAVGVVRRRTRHLRQWVDVLEGTRELVGPVGGDGPQRPGRSGLSGTETRGGARSASPQAAPCAGRLPSRPCVIECRRQATASPLSDPH